MKTFTELNEKKLSKLFMEFNDSPSLAGFITAGFPVAISSYLKKKLMEEKGDSVSLTFNGDDSYKDIMTFTLNVVKKGDSVAFIPEFSLGETGKKLINTDEIEFDETAMTKIANGLIAKSKDEDENEVIEVFREAYAGKIYSDDGWKDISNSDDEKGLTFDDETDIGMVIATTLTSILEVLCNNKDASSDIEYDVTGLGKFKVSPAKDTYNVSLTFDKQFKSNCKSDKLSEEIAGE